MTIRSLYYIIYDGNCNLCVNSVKLLEKIDRGERFFYIPMQDQPTLSHFSITPEDCELGMILIDANDSTRRWQGSAAAEEIGRLLPSSKPFVEAYRALPGIKWVGDRIYEQVRDHRYTLFGKRSTLYQSDYSSRCESDACEKYF